jgi:hypothetical protein
MVGTTRSRQLFHEPLPEGGIDYAGGEDGRLQIYSSLLNVVLHD